MCVCVWFVFCLCFGDFFFKHMILSDAACYRTVPLSAPCRIKIQVLYCSSTETDTGVVGQSPRRGGRGGTAFWQQYHLADVSAETSEVYWGDVVCS